jgi:two-component system chemotaxis response regulator CheY
MEKKFKILIVDDSRFIYKTIENILKDDIFEILEQAQNGQIGVEMFEQKKPDIILLDLIMPVKNGIDAARDILKKDPNAKIIMISSMGDNAIIEEAKQLGVKYFLLKPPNAQEVLNCVNDVLGVKK